MSKVLVLGATGALGGYVTQRAIAANHRVSTLVRTPSKLQAELRERVTVHQADLAHTSAWDLAGLFQDHDVVVSAAGHVAEGQVFVDLIARIVTGLESLPVNDRPVCWFLGGAALLDLDDRGRRGVDLPRGRLDVLAPSCQFRPYPPDWTGLASTVSGSNAPSASSRSRSHAGIARPRARTSPLVHPVPARSPGTALLRSTSPRDDRLLCRCCRPGPRQSRSLWADVSPSGWAGVARWDARQEEGVGSQTERGLAQAARIVPVAGDRFDETGPRASTCAPTTRAAVARGQRSEEATTSCRPSLVRIESATTTGRPA
jgi:hypothetical protein